MTYKILTLDGGGAWALIEVKALIKMFGAEARGNQVLAQFDMVAANSGGSIVLGGLVENVTLGTLLGYFMDATNREAIFSPTSSFLDRTLQELTGIGPKYSAAKKLTALEKLMPLTGTQPITGIMDTLRGPAGAPVHLLIVGFDYDHNRATFFRSTDIVQPCLGLACSPGVTLAQAIHASSNAPIDYFDAPATFPDNPARYWDGGISGFNNPVLAAVTEAVVLGIPPAQIAALSLGTGTVQLPLAARGAPASPLATPWQGSNLKNDLNKLASSILDDPPDSASFIAHAMTLGDGAFPAPAVSRIVRMNPLLAPVTANGTAAPPGGMTATDFHTLCNIGMDAVKPEEVTAIAAYADLWLNNKAPNQPIHNNGADPPTDLGYETYSGAVAAWEAIS